MTNYATSLYALFQRSVDGVVDEIAKDGVKALKNILDDYKTEDISEYEVFAHVSGSEVTFEILIPKSALDMNDAETKSVVDDSKNETEDETERTPGVRTYGFQPSTRVGRITRMLDSRRDARTPVRDARRDARKPPQTLKSKAETAQMRLVKRNITFNSPKSMKINRDGKVSFRMKRSIEPTEDGGVKMPKGKFQDIMGRFVKDLEKIILENFVPEFERIIERHLG